MTTYEVTVADLAEQQTAVVCGHAPYERIGAFLGPAFGEVIRVVASQGHQVAGAPFARYRQDADGSWDIEAGFPVDASLAPRGRVEPSSLQGGRVARTIHVGDYEGVAQAYEALSSWVIDNGYRITGAPWESYLDEPSVREPRTELFLPCAEPHR